MQVQESHTYCVNRLRSVAFAMRRRDKSSFRAFKLTTKKGNHKLWKFDSAIPAIIEFRSSPIEIPDVRKRSQIPGTFVRWVHQLHLAPHNLRRKRCTRRLNTMKGLWGFVGFLRCGDWCFPITGHWCWYGVERSFHQSLAARLVGQHKKVIPQLSGRVTNVLVTHAGRFVSCQQTISKGRAMHISVCFAYNKRVWRKEML